MKLFLAMSVFVYLLTGCAHHRDVRPGDDGLHKVLVRNEDTEAGTREAISQANHFCEKRGQYAAFVKEEQKYTGDMDEKTYKNAKRATNVAKTVGGAAWVLGGRRESTLGSVVGIGGAAADSALGEGYTIEMKFKCK